MLIFLLFITSFILINLHLITIPFYIYYFIIKKFKKFIATF